MVSCSYNHLMWFLWQIKLKKKIQTSSRQYWFFRAELLLCICPLLLCTNRNKNVKKFGFSTLQTGHSTVSSDGQFFRETEPPQRLCGQKIFRQSDSSCVARWLWHLKILALSSMVHATRDQAFWKTSTHISEASVKKTRFK